MHRLTRILSRATRDVAPEYFRLNIDGGDPVYRERVYCYELYHQMRLRWPHDTDYRLNGEIDKAAHPILRQLGAAHAKPDFLVHRPGHMAGNYAIIEVKTYQAANADIRGDLEKLALFLNVVQYQRAIYLMFGAGADPRILNRIANVAGQIRDLPAVEVWLHQEAGTASQCAAILQAEPLAPEEVR